MTKGQIIVQKAKEYFGVKENPANSNNVIFNTEYYGYSVSGSAYPWCVVFVWYVFMKCGLSKYFYDGKKTASCRAVKEWGSRVGLMYSKNYEYVQAGDLILFDFDKNGTYDHIGIIEKFENGKIITIEGNTSTSNNSNGGEVMQRIRNPYAISCIIIRPPFENSCFVDETKENVKRGQRELNTFLDLDIKVDGIRGNETKRACIKAVQKVLSCKVDGIRGKETKSAISKVLLKRGARSNIVSVIEILLYCQGYNPNGIEYPGIFGLGLYNAVKSFQNDKKLLVDGIVGKDTLNKLLE